ncbi:hypothetical protein QC764_601993 [Podospora pseudoanserina]|uniref:Uncharacterized protein n=1 Tax=Podospora pseudoanserina TaxID=2609844 RepID=A0ABR0HT39_9PEZI|nr:hypothetical protein QC764_601993 [Podospora pseudoanserina]
MLRWDISIPQEISTQKPLMRSSSKAKSREQAAAEDKAAAANWPRGPQERRQRRREQKRSANRGTFPISKLTVERTGGASHRRMLRSPAITVRLVSR